MLPPLLSGPLPLKPLWSAPPAALSPSSPVVMAKLPPETVTLPFACAPVSTYTPPSVMVTSSLPEISTGTV